MLPSQPPATPSVATSLVLTPVPGQRAFVGKQMRGNLTAAPDPVFAQIALHKTLVAKANALPDGYTPEFEAAADEEEAALQILGDMAPTSVAGAAAQLQYMADVEGCWADEGSPLLRTVMTVAKALAAAT